METQPIFDGEGKSILFLKKIKIKNKTTTTTAKTKKKKKKSEKRFFPYSFP